jgi:CRISPR-associated protein Cmr2
MGSDAVAARWHDDDDLAFVSFSLGPVQSFIEAARSVRDLWTGSYLLSYLTFQAMLPILRREELKTEEAFVFPVVADLPLWRLEQFRQGSIQERPEDEALLTSCIPNKFIAVVPGEEAPRLADDCASACRRAWSEIAGEVARCLEERIGKLPRHEGWDRSRWNSQVGSFFEVRTAVLPWRKAGRAVLGDWVSKVPTEGTLWIARLELLAGLMEATRSVRHVPSYFPEGLVPQKCTLLGTYEQMGPAKLEESRAFWRALSENGPYRGTRTGRNERLSAISLVKRFAWPDSLAERLEIGRIERRFPDTATVAAARWLEHEPPLDPDTIREDERRWRWSGQWLHWKVPNEGKEDEEDDVPGDIWNAIRAKKRDPKHPVLPTYYAVLVLDGDRMGKWLRGDYKRTEGSVPPGDVIQSAISKALARFAMRAAPSIVEGPKAVYRGTLVYSGGDDVLAMMPTETVLDCAARLHREYGQNWPKDELRAAEDATVSAGIAVAHHKEDLRYVLQAARQAEKAAKKGGRNALALTICRRSGEHTTALLPWDMVGKLQELVAIFQEGASDRWTYALRAELPALDGLSKAAFQAEVRRLIGRLDEETSRRKLEDWLGSFFEDHLNSMKSRGRQEGEIRRDFVTLCQSASFLARGRDNR